MDLTKLVRTLNNGLANPQKDLRGFAYKANSFINATNVVTDFINNKAGNRTGRPGGIAIPSGAGAYNRLEAMSRRDDPLLSVDWVGMIFDPLSSGAGRGAGYNSSSSVIPWEYIDTITTPDISVESNSVFRAGKMKHYAGVLSVGSITLSLHTGSNSDALKLASSWISAVYNNKTGNYSMPKDYKKQVHVYLIDAARQEVCTIRFFGCFPTSWSSYNLEASGSTPLVTTLTLSVDSVSITGDQQAVEQIVEADQYSKLFPKIPAIPNIPNILNVPGLPVPPQWPDF